MLHIDACSFCRRSHHTTMSQGRQQNPEVTRDRSPQRRAKDQPLHQQQLWHHTASPPKHVQDRSDGGCAGQGAPGTSQFQHSPHGPAPCSLAHAAGSNTKIFRDKLESGIAFTPRIQQVPTACLKILKSTGISRIPKFSTLGSYNPASVFDIRPARNYRHTSLSLFPKFPTFFRE